MQESPSGDFGKTAASACATVIILPVDDLSTPRRRRWRGQHQGHARAAAMGGWFGADLDLHFPHAIGTGANPNVAVVVIGIEDGGPRRWSRHREDRQAGGRLRHRRA
jgi:hypothetical protein